MSVCCIGELLIDFICKDINQTLVKGINFEKKAGGAPANVAATVSKLGGEAVFIGKVGTDPFGDFLKITLNEVGVNTEGIVQSRDKATTFAFVSLQDNGERDFVFNRGADEELDIQEIDINSVVKSKVVHFGSATALLGGKLFDTYTRVFNEVKESPSFISFDPNFRLDLWKGKETIFIDRCKIFIKEADLVKVSDEELRLLTGEKNFKGVSILHDLGARIITVTLAKKGTLVSVDKESVIIPSINVKALDTTGAGDAFIGAMLYKIASYANTKNIDFETIKKFVSFSNKVAALTCTKYGAISSLPTLEDVNSYKL